ncbi:hypothetical protein ACOBQX_22485 [Actinokineospora sp. G85]|uniref:hypothetical protein n=1 Tax=Actinokineospora sp. G85 TaxID=3406626 RepID=UPI003C77FD2D
MNAFEPDMVVLAVVYHERWEQESVFDGIETPIRGGSTVVLRSKHYNKPRRTRSPKSSNASTRHAATAAAAEL